MKLWVGTALGFGVGSLKLEHIISQAIWTRSGVGRHMALETQHAIFVMSDGQLINLSLAFSHLELDSILVHSPNRR